ncbi:MAG: hypothetical protein WC236_00930 [Gallionellaceae bacterium]
MNEFQENNAKLTAMIWKNILCQVGANCLNLNFWMPLSLVCGYCCNHYFGTLMPYERPLRYG